MENNVFFEQPNGCGKDMKFYGYENDCIKYTGVWQEDGEGSIVSYGTVSWLDFGFGGTSFAIEAMSDGEVKLILDEKAELSVSFKGSKFFVTSPGKHILRMRVRSRSKIKVKGVMIQDSCDIFCVPERTYVQFIGDSITHRLNGFAMIAPEMMKLDYSVVAHCGMSLKDGWGWYRIPEWLDIRPGMETNYFKLERPDESETFTDYNFKYGRKPDVIVIFLGTNDYLDCPEQRDAGNIEIFAGKYTEFVGHLRKHYPNSLIYIMKATSDQFCRNQGIDAAFSMVKEKFDNVKLIDSDTWNVEISDDGTHPTDDGHRRLADGIAKCFENDGII